MKRNLHILLILFLLVAMGSLHAQQGNVWCFGLHSGLDFNYSPPKIITSAASRTNIYYGDTSEGTSATASSIADCRGKLLFYATETQLFNRYHQVMPNGTFFPYSCTTGGISLQTIVPVPGDTNKYYLFYYFYNQPNNTCTPQDNGYYYSIIDMTLDSGRGDVVSGKKNILLKGYSFNRTFFDKFLFIPKNTGDGYWLLNFVSKTDSLYVYPITSSGIGGPRSYEFSNKYILDPASLSGRIVNTNHKGDKIFTVLKDITDGTRHLAMFDFNSSNGKMFPYPKVFKDSLRSNISVRVQFVTDIEFSSTDSLMYVALMDYENNLLKYHSVVRQYETYASNLESTISIVYQKDYTMASGACKFQIGPDNKIYVLRDTCRMALSVINNPDKKGKACNFQEDAIYFGLEKEKDGYHNKLSAYMPNIYFPVRPLLFSSKSSCIDSVQFNNHTGKSYFQGFTWYFGDGDSSAEYSPYHQYKKSGKYLVRLAGSNSCGARLWNSDTIEVNLKPHAAFNLDSLWYSCGQAHVQISSTAQDSDIIQTYWQWGDSSATDSGTTVTHVYDSSGDFIITQRVLTAYCTDSITDTITIQIDTLPKASFTADITAGCRPLKVNFQSTSTAADSLLWLLDDGAKSNKASFQHIYTDTGYHTVRLIALNTQGCRDTTVYKDYIYASPRPVAAFSYSMDTVCGQTNVSFNNKSQHSEKYLWDFGDGSTDTAASLPHAFDKDGDYVITLKASNAYCDSIITQKIKIKIPEKPAAAFSISADSICTGKSISIKSTAKGKDLSYFYSVSDGRQDTSRNTAFTFEQPDKYWIKQTVTDRYGCTASDSALVVVLPWPAAAFHVSDSAISCHQIIYRFENTSSGAVSYRWDFGDKTPKDNTQNPFHSFHKDSTYTVRLIASNGICTDTFIRALKVKLRSLPTAAFHTMDSAGCMPYTVHLNNLSTEADGYSWDFGNGDISTDANPVYTFTKPGNYTVILTASSKEGCEVKSKPFIITVYDSLKAHISSDGTEGCSPLIVHFSSKSYIPSDGSPIYFWQYGDGNSSTSSEGQHIFRSDKDTSFTVKLYIKTGACVDSDQYFIHLNSLQSPQDQAQMLGVTVVDNQNLLLQWNALKGARRYIIERREESGDFLPVAATKDTFYLDRKVKFNDIHYSYRVEAKDACENSAAKSHIATNIVLHASRIEDDTTAWLSWNPYQQWRQGVQEYILERQQPDGSWKEVNSSVNTSATDQTFGWEDATHQCYRVTAIEQDGNHYQSLSNESCLGIPLKVYTPNAFTPNDDQINERFDIKGRGIESYSLQIYNRWGELVFESRDIHHSWDGHDAATGVYFYILSVKGYDGESQMKKGTVTLLR